MPYPVVLMEPGSAFELYPIATLRDLVLEVSRRYSDKPALSSKRGGRWEATSYRRLGIDTARLDGGLSRLGAVAGDRVALIGPNSTEWALSYLGITAGGRVVVPVDRDLKGREVATILKVSGVRTVIGGGPQLELVLEARRDLPGLEQVISMECERGDADLSFGELLAEEPAPAAPFQQAALRPDDLAALIFTSGTTGAAKAVMLSHRNIASNVVDTSHHVAINRDDVLLSVLPLHHTYECTAGFLTALYQGASICYAESLRRIPDNLCEVRASVMLGVPALFESMYDRVEKAIRERSPRKAALALKLCRLGRMAGFDLRRRLFAGLHRRFGGRLRLMISGGAALNPKVAAGFRSLGIDLIQGYGMTEHSPIISVNRIQAFKDASVGTPLPNAEVRIVDGEITVRGPSVMLGYLDDDEATGQALQSGWLFTGDLGYLDDDGFLFINGRKKSVIVTPNGKNVYPEELEAVLNESPFVLESLVWGGADPDPAAATVQAILVPDPEAIASELGRGERDPARIEDLLAGEIRRCNRELAGYKRIKTFQVRLEEFEKTTTRKIKRYLYTAPRHRIGQPVAPTAGDSSL